MLKKNFGGIISFIIGSWAFKAFAQSDANPNRSIQGTLWESSSAASFYGTIERTEVHWWELLLQPIFYYISMPIILIMGLTTYYFINKKKKNNVSKK